MKYIIPFLVVLPFALLSQENSGCTDSSYQEYSYLATNDDGSCQTLINCESDCNLTGDINCNGTLDGTDAFLISQWIVGLYNLPCEQSMTGLNPDQLQEIVDLMEGQLNVNYNGSSVNSFNFLYPDGMLGDGISGSVSSSDIYTVPNGKRLYVLSAQENLYINNLYVGSVPNGKPFILNSSDELKTGTFWSYGFHGFLIDENSQINAVSDAINSSEGYTVPNGKKLFILHNSDNQPLYVNGINISISQPSKPFILNSNDVLTTGTSTNSTFHGYLVDEDYLDSMNSGLTSSGTGAENNTFSSEENGNIIGSVADQSEVTGPRIYYTDNYNILETDETGSFTNTLYDGEKNVFQMFLVKETQTLYWIESSSSSNYTAEIYKSSLLNFNPIYVGIYSGDIYSLKDMYVTSNEVIYLATTPSSIIKIENNIQDLFVSAYLPSDISFDSSSDQYFYSTNNGNVYNNSGDNLFPDNLSSLVFNSSAVKLFVLASDNRIVSFDVNGNNFIEHLPPNWGSFFNLMPKDFDVLLDNNTPTFYFISDGSISKCTSENDIQVIKNVNSNMSDWNHNIFSLNEDLVNINDSGNTVEEESQLQIIYTDNYNILETDEFGSFTNTLYDGEKNVYQMFLEKETQTLYWIESTNTDSYSAEIYKSSLSNFNPIYVGVYSGYVDFLRDMHVTSDEVLYILHSPGIVKIENNIQEIFLETSYTYNMEFNSNNDSYFYSTNSSVYNNSGDVIFSDNGGISSIVYNLSTEKLFVLANDYRLVSLDYPNNSTEHFPSNWGGDFYIYPKEFDVLLDNNTPIFYFMSNGSISKCTSENDLQIIKTVSTPSNDQFYNIVINQINN